MIKKCSRFFYIIVFGCIFTNELSPTMRTLRNTWKKSLGQKPVGQNPNKTNKTHDKKRKNFTYSTKFKIIEKYVLRLNREQQKLFYTNGILPCQYCKEHTYIGPTKEYMKYFSFSNIKRKFMECEKLNIDHFIPCCQGGNANIENGIVSCTYCNKDWLKDEKKNLDDIKMFFLKQHPTHGPMIDDDTEEKIRNFLNEKPYRRT